MKTHLTLTGYEAGDSLCGVPLGARSADDRGVHFVFAPDCVIRDGVEDLPVCVDCVHELALSYAEDGEVAA